MRDYFDAWEGWTTATFTSAAVRARIQEFQTHGSRWYIGKSRAQFVMVGELYTPVVLAAFDRRLVLAEAACDNATAPDGRAVDATAACLRVGKARAQLQHTARLAAAANATLGSRYMYTAHETIDANAVVGAARALLGASVDLAGKHVVNVYYTLGEANALGDLLGLLAARDAPDAWGGGAPLYMLPRSSWLFALDPRAVGKAGA